MIAISSFGQVEQNNANVHMHKRPVEEFSMSATVEFELDHVTFAVSSLVEPSEYVPVASKVTVSSSIMVHEEGDRLISSSTDSVM